MLGFGKEGLFNLTYRIPTGAESAQQQMRRLRDSWSIVADQSGAAGFIPTTTYTIPEESPVCIPLLLEGRKTTEVYQSHDDIFSFMYIKRLGAFSVGVEKMAFRQTEKGILELEKYTHGVLSTMPHRHVLIEAQSVVKVVDPASPPLPPVGETALLQSMTETRTTDYDDVFLVGKIRLYRDLTMRGLGLILS